MGAPVFRPTDLQEIDEAYRAGGSARCPRDAKPLVTTTWGNEERTTVYFLCRACSRIGAITYATSDKSIPGIIGRPPRNSSRPPPTSGTPSKGS